jgi:hypothetical protein
MRCSPTCLLASLALAVASGSQQETPRPGDAPTASPTAAPTVAEAAARPRPADAQALLASFARMPGLEAAYEEEKHIALLALPLRSRGKLYFLPPGHLTRLVEAPEPATLTISPAELRLQDRDGTEVVDLRRSDKLRLFITALVQVFAGDEARLRQTFSVDYRVDAALPRVWSLTLAPRAEPLDKMLKALVLHGEGEAVLRIEVVEPNGDRTVTRIVTADPSRRFDAAERRRWFGIEAR